MTQLNRWIAFLTLSILLLTPQAHAVKKVKLFYNLKKGDKATYNLVIDGKTVVSAMNQKQNTDLLTKMKITQEVEDVDESGKISIGTLIDESSMSVNGQTGPSSCGQKITMEMLRNGQVLKSEGLESQQNLNQLQIKFPDYPVGSGDSWKIQEVPNQGILIPFNYTYEVVGFEEVMGVECVKIQSTMISGKIQEKWIDLSIEAQGLIYFDNKRGVMVKNEVKSKMNMVMDNQIDGKMEKITTQMSMHLKLDLLKLKPSDPKNRKEVNFK